MQKLYIVMVKNTIYAQVQIKGIYADPTKAKATYKSVATDTVLYLKSDPRFSKANVIVSHLDFGNQHIAKIAINDKVAVAVQSMAAQADLSFSRYSYKYSAKAYVRA